MIKTKNKKQYSLILTSNTAVAQKQINLSQKQITLILSGVAVIGFCFIAFLTDYFRLNVDQWKLQSLHKENKHLNKDLNSLEEKLEGLETEVQQISDFSDKLKLITTVASGQQNAKHLGYGKTSLDTKLLKISNTSSNLSHNHSTNFRQQNKMNNNSSKEEIEIRIDKLSNASSLIKQDVWTLYTDLEEKKDFINNTPSIVPTQGGWVSSTYGLRNETMFETNEPQFHRGLDIAADKGTLVFATADGKVVHSGYDEFGYGNLLIIDHGFGLKTYYAHLSEIKSKIGQMVSRGQAIGTVGSTGRSTGPHLHYEVRIFGQAVNPENYILDDSLSAYYY